MSKIFKIAAYLIITVIVLIIVAVVVAPMMIDANDYKPQIASAVKKYTGREIAIDDKLNLSVFPWLGIETGQVSLSNAPGFADLPFAAIDATQIKVKIIPLLSGKVEVSRIVLKGLNLNLEKNKSGLSNWNDLISKTETVEKPMEEKSTPDTQQKDERAPLSLTIGGVSVENANIVWDDRQKGQHIEISQLNFFTDPLLFDEPVGFEMSLSLHNKEPELTESLEMSGEFITNSALDNFNINNLKLRSETVGDSIPGGSLKTDLALSADVNLKEQLLKIAGLRLNVADLSLTGELSGETIVDSPKFKGPLTISEVNPKELFESLGIAVPITSDANVLNSLKASFFLSSTDNALALNDISIQLDETSITGKTTVTNFADPSIGFDYQIDSIDVDRYLSPKKKSAQTAEKGSTEQAPASQETGSASKDKLPVKTLRSLNLNGKVKINTLKLSGIEANGVAFDINGKNGLISTKQSIKNLYQGRYNGTTRIDARGSVPKISLAESLSGLNVAPFLMALNGKAPISGTAQFNAKLSGIGADTDAIKSSLNGTLDALLTDGAVQGFDLIKMIRTAKALLGKEEAEPQTDENDKTEFSEIKFAANIRNGVMDNHELIAKSPLLNVDGAGKINLVNENIDYKIMAKLAKSLKDQGENEIEKKGIPIAINLTGTLSDPSYKFDFVETAKEKYKAKIEKKKEKLLEKLDEKVGPGASDLLKQFF